MEPGGRNRFKRIRSRNGVVVTLDDQEGQEALQLETPGGQRLTLQDGPGSVTLEDANGNRITLDAQGIHIEAAAKVTVQAAQVEVKRRHGQGGQCDGAVQRRRQVRSAADPFGDLQQLHTPGAGNVW
jgi:hypothetical protein